MTFYGESLGVDYAQVIGGADVTTALRYRAESVTLTAGDEWRAWVYPGGPTYLSDPGEPVVISWVAGALVWRLMFLHPDGIINTALKSFMNYPPST